LEFLGPNFWILFVETAPRTVQTNIQIALGVKEEVLEIRKK
jgi:hypothetical protein